jgi:CTP:molybdopterin cytidylyltransferase MocA
MAETQTPASLAVVILAAGKGTRMKNPEMTKVMYPIEGRPMVAYVVDLTERLGIFPPRRNGSSSSRRTNRSAPGTRSSRPDPRSPISRATCSSSPATSRS